MTCETVTELLLDFVEGELSAPQAAELQAHLDTCFACAAKHRETRALLGDLGAARSVEQRAWSSGASQAAPLINTSLPPETRIGDFEIIAELGRGGMGVVYRAKQLSLDRVVALKILSPVLVQSERAVIRFAREAQAAARLHHTNIVPVYAQGREGDHLYYAMEYVNGESLDEIIEQQRSVQGATTTRFDTSGGHSILDSAVSALRSAVSTIRLSRTDRSRRSTRDFRHIARLIAGVAEGLDHAHKQGVVHRDIKPQNLLRGPDGQLHITDFGLARLLNEPGLTLSTEIVGTPAYMAPEQITRGTIDQRTDIYSLGATFYEMLTLQRPFQAESYDHIVHQILTKEPRPPRRIDPHIPPDLQVICLRALEKEPPRRFPSAAEFAHDLRRYADDLPIASRRISLLEKTIRWIRRHPARATAIAAIALVLALLPVVRNLALSTAQAQLDRALTTLRDDYRKSAQARDQIGWLGRVGGDSRERAFINAFASIREAPSTAIDALTELIKQQPDDPDAHYLIAWAYTRRAHIEGIESHTDARRHINIADNLPREPSALGWFFRGQAIWGASPADASACFDRAIEVADKQEGFAFTQAMLHQGRAMNQIMYSWHALDPDRALSLYDKAVGRLEYLALVQPSAAYTRYLRSLTHLLAAESYLFSDPPQPDKADQAYAAALEAAREAQAADPASPRAFAAEAGCYESRGKHCLEPVALEEAVAAWNHFDDPAVAARLLPSDKAERYEYQMRLHFWLGQYAQAESRRAARYSIPNQSTAEAAYCESLIAAARGDLPAARAAILNCPADHLTQPECRLHLRALCRLLKQDIPESLQPQPPQAARLSPGWNAAWLDALLQYEAGDLDWAQLREVADTGTDNPESVRLRMASAWYFRGLRALAVGDRAGAISALESSRNHYDNENYSFRAEFLLIRLRLDETFPPWLTIP